MAEPKTDTVEIQKSELNIIRTVKISSQDISTTKLIAQAKKLIKEV